MRGKLKSGVLSPRSKHSARGETEYHVILLNLHSTFESWRADQLLINAIDL